MHRLAIWQIASRSYYSPITQEGILSAVYLGPVTIAELSFCIWLLVNSVRKPKSMAHACNAGSRAEGGEAGCTTWACHGACSRARGQRSSAPDKVDGTAGIARDSDTPGDRRFSADVGLKRPINTLGSIVTTVARTAFHVGDTAAFQGLLGGAQLAVAGVVGPNHDRFHVPARRGLPAHCTACH